MNGDKDLIYTHRVSYTFTDLVEPERCGLTAHQDFTREDWAEDFYRFAKDSNMFKNVNIGELTSEEQPLTNEETK